MKRGVDNLALMIPVSWQELIFMGDQVHCRTCYRLMPRNINKSMDTLL